MQVNDLKKKRRQEILEEISELLQEKKVLFGQLFQSKQELKKLEAQELVIQFLKARKKWQDCQMRLQLLNESIAIKKMESCDHLYAAYMVDSNYQDDMPEESYYCIKCGLDRKLWSYDDCYNPGEQDMYQVNRLGLDRGTLITYLDKDGQKRLAYCRREEGLQLATALLQENPNMSDEELVKAFLENLYNTKEEKKKAKAKGKKAAK